MILEPLDAEIVSCHSGLTDFLAESNTAEHLKHYQATKFGNVKWIGIGEQGLVLQCTVPHRNNTTVAIKLFFENKPPLDQAAIWALQNESQYYAGCAYHLKHLAKSKAQTSSPPPLFFNKWAQLFKAQRTDVEVFTTIQNDLEAAPRYVGREQIVTILEGMCAYGWVIFNLDICHQLPEILPREQQQMKQFTGDFIVGIVKPFLTDNGCIQENREKQFQSMLLMRSFGWKLREVHDRNWINGCLVDGADVEVRPRHPRYLERSWTTAFFEFFKGHETQIV